ncbi:MAG: bifunctional nuclease family protein [Acidobacteriota bacterium]
MSEAEEQEDREILMEIKGLMIDPATNHPIVILRDDEGDRFLPIWIGIFEASAIQMRLESVQTERPMTHDLLGSVFSELGAEVRRIRVCDLRENTFFAEIEVETEHGEIVRIDSRPSDAMALALRVGAPVWVKENVLERARSSAQPAADEEKLREWFAGLDPDDLGKYTM